MDLSTTQPLYISDLENLALNMTDDSETLVTMNKVTIQRIIKLLLRDEQTRTIARENYRKKNPHIIQRGQFDPELYIKPIYLFSKKN